MNNTAHWKEPFLFEIKFECLKELQEDLEWKITYVGSAESEEHDQILDSIMVGPVIPGVSEFVFQANAPDASKIPKNDFLGVTAVLLTCSYKTKEFIRVGYYVNNEYDSVEMIENPPPEIDLSRITRNILESKPRVTRFPIEWD